MLLKEYLMVICRNAGRYFSVANRSDFYHDFLRSLYDKPNFPAFFDNRVECFNYYITNLGYLPPYDINDESKQERYIYFYNTDDGRFSAITIREVIMKMYDTENMYQYALKSLEYTARMFELYQPYIENSDIVHLVKELKNIEFEKYTGEEEIIEISCPSLAAIIQRSLKYKELFGINKPQNAIENKRKQKQ